MAAEVEPPCALPSPAKPSETVEGGMSQTAIPVLPSGLRETVVNDELEVLIYYLGCLAQASYLVRDRRAKTAFVIDPRRDVDIYLQEMESKRTRLRGVLLTHVHADFVSGHMELSRRGDADVYFGPGIKARASCDVEEVHDGQILKLSKRYSFRALHTPGHTPESVTWLLVDERDDTCPRVLYAFTGDTLFIGSVGRPDLVGSVGHTAEDMALLMYNTIWTKLMALPDDVKVFPGHGAGSPCGKSLSDALWSTIGQERITNPALQVREREDFVAYLTSGQPSAPQYFAHSVRKNLAGASPIEDDVRSVSWLPASQVLSQCTDNAVIIDTRDAVDFARGHLRGSWNIPKGGAGGAMVAAHEGNFAIWIGTLIPQTTKIFLVTSSGEELEAVERLARIGYKAAAVVSDTVDEWQSNGLQLDAHKRVLLESSDSVKRLIDDSSSVVVDVRTDGEYAANHLNSAVSWPLNKIREDASNADRSKKYYCYCVSGFRSSIATSYLGAKGYDVTDIVGGFAVLDTTAPELTATGQVCPNLKKTADALRKGPLQ